MGAEQMNRRTFLKILGIAPLSIGAASIPFRAAAAESGEISFDQMIGSFLPGELVVFAGVNTSFLRRVLRYELKKKGLIASNYIEWLRDIDGEFFWEACEQLNQTYRRLARARGVPVILIVPSDSDHRRPPLESDIYRFGGLNQEADKIIFVYRDPKPIGDGDYPILLTVGKNRSGPMWEKARLSWSRGRLRTIRETTRLRL